MRLRTTACDGKVVCDTCHVVMLVVSSCGGRHLVCRKSRNVEKNVVDDLNGEGIEFRGGM